MITDDTLASLRDNDDRLDNLFLYMDDYTFGHDDDDLCQALRGNTRVTVVEVDMHCDEMSNAIASLMGEIGQLSNLQRLRCSSSGDYAVTMAALAKAMDTEDDDNSKQCPLISLDLANFLLQRPNETGLATESYPGFVNALRQHPTLKNFSLGFGFASTFSVVPTTGVNPPNDEDTAHASLTPLIKALRTMPNLEWIRLDGASAAPARALSSFGLQSLVQGGMPSQKLATLEVHEFDLSSSHILAMAQALETNSHLKTLSLTCNMFSLEEHQAPNASNRQGPSTYMALATAIRKNNTLEKLYIPLKILSSRGPRSELNDRYLEALTAIFQALEGNFTLDTLHVTFPENTAVSKLETTSLAAREKASKAFRHMLQHNYSLQSIQIPFFCDAEWQDEIALHMKLNAMGRGQLVRTPQTRRQWVDALDQVPNDDEHVLSCLFHLLLLNPLLCSTASNNNNNNREDALAVK